MPELKLIGLDAEDLAIVSAHLQDAIVRVGDMSYLAKQRRFVAVVNRFDWAASAESGGSNPMRRRAGLHFERVLSAGVQGIDLAVSSQMLSLLAIRFEPTEAPGGFATLVFAGGGAIRLELECIEVELGDMGSAWRASRQPEHEPAPGGEADGRQVADDTST